MSGEHDLSITLLGVATQSMPTFKYFRLVTAIAGLSLLYAMYRDSVCTDKNKIADAEVSILKPNKLKPFQCVTATEDELRARCLALGKNDEYIRFAILAFRSGKTRKEIARELFLTESTVKEYKRRRKRELESI